MNVLRKIIIQLQIILGITLFSKLENIKCICYSISHYDVLFLSSYGYIIYIYIYILHIPLSSRTGASSSYCHIQDTHWGILTPLQRCNQSILQCLCVCVYIYMSGGGHLAEKFQTEKQIYGHFHDFFPSKSEKTYCVYNCSVQSMTDEGATININFLITFNTKPLAKWVECSPMVWETGVQSQVNSYQRLKKNGTWCPLV